LFHRNSSEEALLLIDGHRRGAARRTTCFGARVFGAKLYLRHATTGRNGGRGAAGLDELNAQWEKKSIVLVKIRVAFIPGGSCGIVGSCEGRKFDIMDGTVNTGSRLKG
jgi:hypothetical protein